MISFFAFVLLLIRVGVGITEVQIIQWYVEEGARIEEWKPLCQYQSDKAVDDVCCLLLNDAVWVGADIYRLPRGMRGS